MHPAASPARRPSGPLTLADWRVAVCGGASLTQLVHERLAQALLSGGDVAWILPPDAPAMRAHIAARLAELEALAAAAPDRRTLLAQLPLLGVPFVVKDNIDVEGLTTTAGCPAFAHTAQRSATVVRRLLQAGAVLIGKSNLDQFATGLVGVRSPYGVPVNTFDPAFVPGGSSSGSAVAVAAGLVSFSLGTDTAGSGRVPAAFNNIVGLKPTRG
ncbi:MAG: amidase family protein, partial [Betaproteobacteria bacterium]